MVNESSWGPFRPLTLLWFPISLPAIGLGMLAAMVFWLVNAGLAACTDAVSSASEAIVLFGDNARGVIFGFDLVDRIDPGASRANPVWLFVTQLVFGIALWATFGVAICRCVALRLTRDEYIGAGAAMGFGLRNAGTAFCYPLVVVGCMAAVVVFNAALGGLMQIPWIGIAFYLLLPVSFVLSGLLLVLFLTGVAGAGMVLGAISVERRGTLDAWGKSLNYIFARPLHFVVYLVLTKVVVVDLLIYYTIERRVIHEWAARSLSPLWRNSRFEAILAHEGGLTGLDAAGSWLWWLFGAGLTLTLVGFAVTCVFSAFTGMFLILRSDVDGIDATDIELDEDLADPVPQPVLPEAGCEAAPPAAAPPSDADPSATPPDPDEVG